MVCLSRALDLITIIICVKLVVKHCNINKRSVLHIL
jgi:hypothetical protein